MVRKKSITRRRGPRRSITMKRRVRRLQNRRRTRVGGKKGKKFKKKKSKKGGFYFGTASNDLETMPSNPETVLSDYLTHIFSKDYVTVEPLGEEGIYGIILVIKFNKTFLKTIEPTTFAIRDYNGAPCKQLILKLCYIDPNLKGNNEKKFGEKQMVSTNAFIQEIETQQHIFKTTNQYLQPITPLIYHYDVKDNNKSKEFLKLLRNNSTNAKMKIQLIENLFQSASNMNLGIIFMEMKDEFKTVANAAPWGAPAPELDTQSIEFLAMVGEVLNRLHFECKVTHGDLHQANILINTTNGKYYTPESRWNILLIDWGRAKIHHRGIRGTQETPIPVNEANIELQADVNHWGYKWLSTATGHGGLPWNRQGVREKSSELKRARVHNYTTSDEALPKYFYQPKGRTKWPKTNQKSSPRQKTQHQGFFADPESKSEAFSEGVPKYPWDTDPEPAPRSKRSSGFSSIFKTPSPKPVALSEGVPKYKWDLEHEPAPRSNRSSGFSSIFKNLKNYYPESKPVAFRFSTGVPKYEWDTDQ